MQPLGIDDIPPVEVGPSVAVDQGRWVRSERQNGRLHRVAHGSWTACGWHFNAQRVTIASSPFDERVAAPLCARCARADADSSDTESG